MSDLDLLQLTKKPLNSTEKENNKIKYFEKFV